MIESGTLVPFFLLRSSSRICALPLASVVEILRPLPVRPVQGVPPFVSGVAVIRGNAVPVIDLEALLGGGRSPNTGRFVTLRIAQRQLALAVDATLGVRSLSESIFDDLPPLLSGSEAHAIASLGALDSELLVLLETSRILSEELWRGMSTGEDRS